jgi:hypothetical protein
LRPIRLRLDVGQLLGVDLDDPAAVSDVDVVDLDDSLLTSQPLLNPLQNLGSIPLGTSSPAGT